MGMPAPVVKLLRSDARNTTALATSLGWASLPRGIPTARRAMNSSGSTPEPRARSSIAGVSVDPGMTLLNRMPRPANSLAQARVNERNAGLLAAYTPVSAPPLDAAAEEFRMIDALSPSSG